LSWVGFGDVERLVGDNAKNTFHSNPENTVFDTKCLIGRKISDPEIKKDQEHWPFKVVETGGSPTFVSNTRAKLANSLRKKSALWSLQN